MNEGVGGQGFAAVEVKRRAVEAGDGASGFLHQENSGGGIPGIQVELPVAVIAARGDVGKVQRGGTSATDAVRAQSELVVDSEYSDSGGA